MNKHHVSLSGYRLPLTIEQVEDGSYMATSPALQGFLVLADSIEELLQLAPDVAKALIESIQEYGDEMVLESEEFQFPLDVEVLVV
jgi:predicted RNase H-like HicB family nuclease